MSLLFIHPQDFDSTAGRKKIIVALHELEAKMHLLEHKIHTMEAREAELRKEIMELIETKN